MMSKMFDTDAHLHLSGHPNSDGDIRTSIIVFHYQRLIADVVTGKAFSKCKAKLHHMP